MFVFVSIDVHVHQSLETHNTFIVPDKLSPLNCLQEDVMGRYIYALIIKIFNLNTAIIIINIIVLLLIILERI